MNDDTYTKCTKCGRPMRYCKGQCCGKPRGCNCKEYGPAVCGVIRQRQPECPYTSVIPSITVDNASNLKDLCDTFVHVADINTTFYIDDKHRTIITWAGPVEYDNYDLATNTLGLRSQFLIDFENHRGAYYDKTGKYEVFGFGNSVPEEPEVYTIAIDAHGQGAVGSYANINWGLSSPYEVTAVSFWVDPNSMQNDFHVVKKDGTTVPFAELADSGDALLDAKYKFNVTMSEDRGGTAVDVPMAITTTPTSVITTEDGSTAISGTYSVDETFYSEQPDTLTIPPLRWKLVIRHDDEYTQAMFTVEFVTIFL